MPATAPTSRPKPLVAALLVAVPLVAIVIAAAVTTTRSADDASTATTISQSGDPEAAGNGAGGGGGDGSAKDTTTTAKPEKKGTTTTTADRKASEPDVPTDPADAGPEGERASVTYPQPTVPASGCSRPSGTAVITLGSAAKPGCLRLGADQEVVVRNRTGKEVSFVAISVNEVIAPGSEMRVGTASSAFGEGRSTFWSPGNPQLSGIVIVG